MKALALLLPALLLGAGCAIRVTPAHSRGHTHHDEYHPAGHVHTCYDDCDHVWDGGAWIVVGHRHRHGCGHVLSGGRWVISAGPSYRSTRSHVCHDECDHVWNDGGWVSCGHRHYHGCGHVLSSGRWVIAVGPRGTTVRREVVHEHVCTHRCEHAWNGSGWIVVGHRHHDGCGHHLRGGRWTIGVRW